eukprot:4708981-Prymnesium_polylepis.1
MAASHGHGPRHVLFLFTVSTLLSYRPSASPSRRLSITTRTSTHPASAMHATSRSWVRSRSSTRPHPTRHRLR